MRGGKNANKGTGYLCYSNTGRNLEYSDATSSRMMNLEQTYYQWEMKP